jgi:hypothetical protein
MSFGWVPEFYAYQLGRCSPIKQHAVLLATPMKSGKNPPQNRIAAEEGHAQRFTVAREKFFLRQHAPHCARERTPQYQRKAVVEPDHSCGSGPHEITNNAVVAVGNPTTFERAPAQRASETLRRASGSSSVAKRGHQARREENSTRRRGTRRRRSCRRNWCRSRSHASSRSS